MSVLSPALRWGLVVISLSEFALAIVGLPAVLNATNFFSIRQMVGLLVYLLAAGLLPVGVTKVLMRRPVGWAFVIAAQALFFSWVGLSLEVAEELIKLIV